MSVRIQVTDHNKNAVVGARVFVKWAGGGTSDVRTDGNGVADTGVSSGTADYVQVWNDQVLGQMKLEDRIYSVTGHN